MGETFDPWWAVAATHLRVSYSVEDATSLTAGTVPAPTVVPSPSTPAGLASLPLTLPTTDTVPAPHQVRATLMDVSTSPPAILGTTCTAFTVDAAGDRPDLATLPAGTGSGGPSDPRGVSLNAQLGLSGPRRADVKAPVTHDAPVPAGRRACAPVTGRDAWNESHINGRDREVPTPPRCRHHRGADTTEVPTPPPRCSPPSTRRSSPYSRRRRPP